jgi:hypothetical protein
MSSESISAAGPPVPADAPPTSNKDATPTIRAADTAFFRLFRFEVLFLCSLVDFPMSPRKVSRVTIFVQDTRSSAADCTTRKRAAFAKLAVD